jgi:hypothetical protein
MKIKDLLESITAGGMGTSAIATTSVPLGKIQRRVKKEDAAGVGIVTKQNATADVPVGGEYMNVKKFFPNKKKKDVAEGILDAFKDKPLPTKPETIKLGNFAVEIEPSNSHIGFAWRDSSGREHYEEVSTAGNEFSANTRKELISKIKDEIKHRERQLKQQGVAEDSIRPNLVAALKGLGFKGPFKLGQLPKWMAELQDAQFDEETSIMIGGDDPEYDPWVAKGYGYGYAYGMESGYQTDLSAQQVVRQAKADMQGQQQSVAEGWGTDEVTRYQNGYTVWHKKQTAQPGEPQVWVYKTPAGVTSDAEAEDIIKRQEPLAKFPSLNMAFDAMKKGVTENRKGVKAVKKKVASVEPGKPRNFVAKNAINTGAGAHKDKKKAAKQGEVKHKKPSYEN